MATAKNDAFIFLLGWIEGKGWWGRGAEGGNEQIFGWLGGLPPIPPVGQTLYIHTYYT